MLACHFVLSGLRSNPIFFLFVFWLFASIKLTSSVFLFIPVRNSLHTSVPELLPSLCLIPGSEGNTRLKCHKRMPVSGELPSPFPRLLIYFHFLSVVVMKSINLSLAYTPVPVSWLKLLWTHYPSHKPDRMASCMKVTAGVRQQDLINLDYFDINNYLDDDTILDGHMHTYAIFCQALHYNSDIHIHAHTLCFPQIWQFHCQKNLT